MIKAQLGDGQVGAKGAADGNQADALEAGGIERGPQPVRRKGVERKINRLPTLACFELGPVGLPRPDVVRRAQMNRVQLNNAGRLTDACGITDGDAVIFPEAKSLLEARRTGCRFSLLAATSPGSGGAFHPW